MRDRESKAWSGIGRLAEVSLQRRRLGHVAAGAVGDEGAVSLPGAGCCTGRVRSPRSRAAEHVAEDIDGQPRTCLTIRRLSERAVHQAEDMPDARVAVGDLRGECLESTLRVEYSVTPDGVLACARFVNESRINDDARIIVDPTRRADKTCREDL